MKKSWVHSYSLSAQRILWSDRADAQADLSLRWAHSHFVGSVMSRLIYTPPIVKHRLDSTYDYRTCWCHTPYWMHMSLVMRKPAFGVCDQVTLKPACSVTEASIRLEIFVTVTRDITLFRQRTTKALIRLRGCAGWSVPLLFAYVIRHVFSRLGSYFDLFITVRRKT